MENKVANALIRDTLRLSLAKHHEDLLVNLSSNTVFVILADIRWGHVFRLRNGFLLVNTQAWLDLSDYYLLPIRSHRSLERGLHTATLVADVT
jgi:hypothetical protein